MKLPRLVALAAAVCAPLALHAQNTVFNDSFKDDTLDPAAYPAVTSTSTGWDVASSKSAPAPANAAGLQINMVATSSGFIEAQALFAPAPVRLLPGTYIELTATFVPTTVLVHSSDTLVAGLFNSGGTPPVAGLLSAGLSSSQTAFASGGAKGWAGYNAGMAFTGGTSKMATRPAQTGANNTDQDLVFGTQSTSAGYSQPGPATVSQSTSAVAAPANGNTYTLDYKLALSSDGGTLTATYGLYNGAGTSNAGANTLIASYSGAFGGTTLLQTPPVFDALALGWRADGGATGQMNLTSLTVTTTGGAPWFVSQPPGSTLASVGSSLTLSATVGGAVDSYQWQKSADGGTTFAAIDATANPSAATASLTFASVQMTDAGTYRLVVANAAGSAASANAVLSVTTSPVPPSITTGPANATVLVGSPVALGVSAYGTSPLTYQWYKSADGGATYGPISGATASSYAISNAALSDSGLYEVTVTNPVGSATSAPATLTVDQAPAITAQPAGATLNAGASATLAVSATGTPPPTYQWYLNGVPIQGATASSYTIASASGADSGNYTVVVGNAAGASVTSSIASVAVLSPTLAATAMTPSSGESGPCPDTRLTITFNQPVSAGVSGRIRIYDASSPSSPVDTIDMAAGWSLMTALRAQSALSTLPLPVLNKSIGGLSNFNYYPVTISGDTATIYPRNNVLSRGRTYYVEIDPGVFTDATGLSYAGVSTDTGWTFGTKASGPAPGSARLVVAADGSGDFCTVQGALDFIPTGNTAPTTIFIRKGAYFEEVYFTGKHHLTFLGEDRSQSLVLYPNNNTFNNVSGTYHRMVVQGDHVNNIAFVNLTIENSTPHGGSQAEALTLNGTTSGQAIVTHVNLLSYQDTLLVNGQAYLSDSHISGDVDFMWGDGPNFFSNCEITALTSGGYYTQIRNPSTNHGNVYVNCTFDAAPGVGGSYLSRIDPTQFPYAEVVLVDCALSNTLNPAGWLLNNAVSAPNADWAYDGLTNLSDGTPFNTGAWSYAAAITSPSTVSNFETPSYVLGNSWSPSLAPIILTQPAAAVVPRNSATSLSVVAAGVPEPTYLWSMNGQPLSDGTQPDGSVVSGSATAKLTIRNVAADEDGASLSVAVTAAGTTVASDAAALTVVAPLPSFTAQPVSQSVQTGSSAAFAGAADGASSYQWYFNGAPVSGATGTSLTVGSVSPLSAGTYVLAATNSSGNSYSAAAVLNVTAAPGQPTLPVIPNGVFNVAAYGAAGDGATDNTSAVQAAINAAIAAGGGTVEVPAAPAAFLCGPITLGSSISLQVDAGATLQALPYGAYPDANNSPPNFISVKNASNVQVVGGGVIDGNGAGWWAAYKANSGLGRPRVLQTTNCSDVLVAGVTLSNGPTMHLTYDNAGNVTIDAVTITAPSTSPNTDGIDPSGANYLIENCSISDGDDDIAVKPGKYPCSNIVVTGCAFGSGHGMSVGGQTNAGLNGLTVTNCTFNGTSDGLRLKADATQGGVVENLTYSNITMTNVTYPILFYSYYDKVGSPGAVSGSSQTTPSKVNSWNSSPPNPLGVSTIPVWRNITVSDLSATGATGYSILWGLPLANGLVSNVTLHNVSISGGAGFEIYDAADVQFTGDNSVGTFVTDNALAITGQPQSQVASAGQSATFTAAVAGASGTAGTAPAYQWTFNGAPLTDGAQSDGSVVSGSSTETLTVSNLRVSDSGSYALTASNVLDGYDVAAGALAPGSLPVTATSSPATLTVNVAPAAVSLSDLSQTYDGSPEAPTIATSPTGLAVKVTYNGSTTPPTGAGAYTVVVTIVDPSFTGSATGTLVIGKANATVTVTPYDLPYDGASHTATATATGVGGTDLAADLNLSGTTHTYPGGAADAWTFHDSGGNYADTGGTVTDVITIGALVRHGLALDGALDGSAQVLAAENDTLNGNAMISGDLLVPGTPSVVLNGHPTYGGTIDGPGAAAPSGYSATLNGKAVLGHVVRRIDPIPMPAVSPPPPPAGARDVTLDKPGDSPGDFSTVRNLTLNGNAGTLVVPAGAYGTFTANGATTLTLGVAGATAPSVYDFQGLILNGSSRIQVVGPVIVNVASSVNLNGSAGDAAHPRWLILELATGGLTLNGNATFSGFVIAPGGTVTINGNATLNGQVAAGGLVVNGNGALVDPGPSADDGYDPWAIDAGN